MDFKYKRTVRICIACLCLITGLGIGAHFMRTDDPCRLRVQEETITPEGGVFVVDNFTQSEMLIGSGFLLEKREWGAWKPLQDGPRDQVLDAIILGPNNNKVLRINWALVYGSLPAGTYRMIKGVSLRGEDHGMEISCEFTIP